MNRLAGNAAVGLVIALIAVPWIAASPSILRTPEQAITLDTFEGSPGESTTSIPAPPAPLAWVGNDFLISYDDDWNANCPSVAATPLGSVDPAWDGSIHAVWGEQNETDPYIPHLHEIHYSMSWGKSGGREWSNDEPAEGDRIISQTGIIRAAESPVPLAGPVPGDALDPAIAVDMFGYIHVVWREMYSDSTWEIHYTRSKDNGRTWTSGVVGDILVSYRAGNGSDGTIPDSPAIAVSNDKGTGSVILHVVWAQQDSKGETQEVYYSRSFNGGDTWTGVEVDRVISDPLSKEFAISPVIAATGDAGELITVAWTQNETSVATLEIFAIFSGKVGDPDTWTPEKPISYVRADGYHAGPPSIAAANKVFMVVWAQPTAGKASPTEILYSYSDDPGTWWLGQEGDFAISFPDGYSGTDPSASIAPNMHAYVAWVEEDQNKWKSKEVHISENWDITNYKSWSGMYEDIVISKPDANTLGEPANAGNVSVAFSYVDAAWRAQVVWDEVNWSSPAKAVDEWEINYNPPVDDDIPVTLGWNLFSVPTVQADTSVTAVLSDSAGDGSTTWDRALWYDAAAPAGARWKQYYTGWNSQLNDLLNIDHTMAIWVRITSKGDGNLTVTGTQPTATTIPLTTGWNMVGYPADDDSTYTVGNLMADTGATFVEGFDPSSAYGTKVLASTYVLRRGEGYWVYVSSDATWTVNW
ncbi:MAG: sialidase family protein [Candidatus Thermoplasmatota archaeon]